MITFMFLRFQFVVYVPHTANKLVTDLILNITSQEYLIFTSLHIGSRLFGFFSKEVRVKKQPGMHLSCTITFTDTSYWTRILHEYNLHFL